VSELPPCLLAVHAHPDDEALFTGVAHLLGSRQGVRQVVVTCTNGSLGFDPLGRDPFADDHDRAGTAVRRATELEQAARALAVDRAVTLGYHDSGMDGWPQNDDPASFIRQDLEVVAARIAEVLREEQPAVVLTYGPDGFYGHPDHVATHQATMAAVAEVDCVERVYYVAWSAERVAFALALADELGSALPAWLGGGTIAHLEVADVVLDGTDVAEAKHRGLAAHHSQVDLADLVALDEDLFAKVFGVEEYVLGWSRDNTAPVGQDFFGGLVTPGK